MKLYSVEQRQALLEEELRRIIDILMRDYYPGKIILCNAVKQVGYDTPVTGEESIFLNSIYRARYPADLGLLTTGEAGSAKRIDH